jgi:hypothetical protein
MRDASGSDLLREAEEELSAREHALRVHAADAPHADEEAHTRLRAAVPAAAAWIETYLDCQQVEWFSFDPAWDPVA